MELTPKAIILITIIVILFAGFFIFLVLIFLRRKNVLIQEQETMRQTFEKEIAESEIEIREETLRNISWELHDNIGQLMTLAKIRAQNAQTPEKMEVASEIIGNALTELRALSKSINPESLRSRTLVESVKWEIERFNRLNFIKSNIEISGNAFTISPKDEIILFRILQEFFSNTIKHSRATELNVFIQFSENELYIKAQDNGVGFDVEKNFDGIGLKNMRKRTELIQAKFDIKSSNAGTILEISYPKK